MAQISKRQMKIQAMKLAVQWHRGKSTTDDQVRETANKWFSWMWRND